MKFQFDRPLLKKNAKVGLKRYYWIGFGVIILAAIIYWAVNSLLGEVVDAITASFPVMQNLQEIAQQMGQSLSTITTPSPEMLETYTDQVTELVSQPENLGAFLGIAGIGALIGTLGVVFVKNILELGKNAFFLVSRNSEAKVGYLFNGFKKKYLGNVGKSFVTKLIVAAWVIGGYLVYFAAAVLSAVTGIAAFGLLSFGSIALFVISIIKYYQYRMAPYILVDDPDISLKDLIARTKAMTKGYKGNLFVLDLSFILWYLLGFCACCIGIIFVYPYVEATWAEAYCFLKANYEQANGIESAAPAAEAAAPVAPVAPVAAAAAAPVVVAAAEAAAEEAPAAAEEAAEVVEEAPVETAEVVEEAPEAVEEAPEAVEEVAEEAAEVVEETVTEAPELTQPELTSADDVAAEFNQAE